MIGVLRMILGLFVFARSRCLTFASAYVFVQAPIDGPSTHRHKGTEVGMTTSLVLLCAVRMCHRDGAVSIGSHVQQDMVISLAPRR